MWIDGELQEFDIDWMRYEGTCKTANNKELLRAKVSLVTEDYAGGAGFFDNIQLLKDLTEEKLYGAEIIYIPIILSSGSSSLNEVPVFGAVNDSVIVAAHIVPSTAITGGDPPLTMQLIHKQTAEVICSKTFQTGVDAPAYQVTDFGPADPEKGVVLQGQSVSLLATGGAYDIEALIIVQWDLR